MMTTQAKSVSYQIDLAEFGIYNDGTQAEATTAGINAAITWAVSEGYNHVLLPAGHYKVKMSWTNLSAIVMPSNLHFEMAKDCVIEMEGNSSPNYNVFQLRGVQDCQISGGKVIGDKTTHIYDLLIGFERGGVNADGSLNSDPNWIRSQVLDRFEHPGLLASFRLWNTAGLAVSGYSFYQYKDTISSATFVGSRNNGQFAPGSPTGRGWFLNPDMTANNKMIYAINITGLGLTDPEIAALSLKVDNSYFTHEGGYGFGLFGANGVEISGVEISNCTGDGIMTGWLQHHNNPADYIQEEMGSRIIISECDIHHCRRQGISLCGSNDVRVQNNSIHHIGFADDGVTSDFRNGVAPMFGIDVESMVGETNIPYKTPDQPIGLELNYRLYIDNNHIYSNNRGHFVNCDGYHITLENNIFEGYNVGGISSYSNHRYVSFLNNTFIGCQLSVQGDNFVNGGVFHNANLRMADVRGAVVQNIQMIDSNFYGTSIYGYFGTPSVNVATGTFTYTTAHEMGNGAQICFEQWVGRVPAGISVDKLYYTVNITANSFQVSETKGGAAVVITDAGEAGFNISRYNYGRCYISNVSIERDWRSDNALTPQFSITMTGAVIRNITVKNYDVSVMVPQNYVGRPNTVEGLTLIEGTARFEGTEISNSQFMRAKSTALGAIDVILGANMSQFTRRVLAQGCRFHRLGVVLDGNSLVTDCQFVKSAIGKANNSNKAIVANSYIENTNVNGHWLTQADSLTLANNVFNNVVVQGTSPNVKLVGNSVL
ncbi:right-handed parallel beta-helix repeat-containing protein [Cohnella herbarum]|uniref:Right-handed parallel beta-helix repeat-containing protein n=1 Tax=Cohnella herbarum TaxID=2728023 RepID=A0A7Z2VH00_9BACL|nr:right-handed parallel beta-helix repeat-containing protein [Cohnella herbarum]QJD82709.1 right-handed parallel beta-helix repeat-containing protein [Cohnella herbarum]